MLLAKSASLPINVQPRLLASLAMLSARHAETRRTRSASGAIGCLYRHERKAVFDAGALDAFDIAGWAWVHPAHADSIAAERIEGAQRIS
jgi:hypothetical protein